jgi:hypothetical protein
VPGQFSRKFIQAAACVSPSPRGSGAKPRFGLGRAAVIHAYFPLTEANEGNKESTWHNWFFPLFPSFPSVEMLAELAGRTFTHIARI